MATIVQHRRTGDRFILLNINGTGSSVNPSRFLNELFTSEKAEAPCLITLCDSKGNLFLANLESFFVVEIDGVEPAKILPEPTYTPQSPPSSYSYGTRENFDEPQSERDHDFSRDNSADLDQEARQQKKEPQTPTTDVQGSSNLDEFSDEDEDWI